MAEKEQAQINFQIPGQRGPRNHGITEKPKDTKGTLKRLTMYFKSERVMLFSLIVVVIIVVCCSVLAPSLQSKAIDIITEKKFSNLLKILFLMLGLYIIYAIGTLFQSKLSAKLSQRIVKRMREELFEKIVNLPVQYLDNHSHGDIMSRMTNDVENISNTVSQSLGSLVSGVLTIMGTVVMMIYYSPLLALFSCTTVILTVCATKFLSGKMRKFFLKRQILLGKLNGEAEEMISGYKTVLAYNRQKQVISKFEELSNSLTKTGIIAEIFDGSMGPVMNVISNIGFVIIATFGGYFAMHGIITVGVISAFIVYAKQFSKPINELAQLYGQIQTAIAGAERVFSIMNEPNEDKSGTKDISNGKGIVTFRNVNFSYYPGKQVLHDFNLEVFAGHKVALVGATGSGKTTVVNLLMRFYQIDSGEILIDNINIKDIPCDILRKNIAIVLQDTVLFSDTVRNNLKYSNLNATDEDMERATQMSNCSNMINHMKDGYDTILTGGGQNLSQGQRQLLAIGRAFLSNPKILILDEATSSVDTQTEKKIQDAMVNLMKNRTSIIIAHRLSTIQDADLIVVMNQGKIAEIGNHETLMKLKGEYYELYMTQFAGNKT